MASASIKHNGIPYKSKGIARRIYDNLKGDDVRDINKEIEWVIDNCTNVNDLELENVLQSLWYDFIGISNNSLWKKISDTVAEYVELGKVKEW